MRAGTLIRLTTASSLVFFIVLLGLANVIFELKANADQLRTQNLALTHQIADQGSQLAELNSQIVDLRTRWIGLPALWSAPSLPADESITYFAVAGTSQSEIEDSLNAANLCKKYRCLFDPGAPPGGEAWALESSTAPTTPCYSPATFHVAWHQTLILPRWSVVPDGSVHIPLVVAWNALEQVLFAHESRHAAIARADLAALMAQAQRYSTCTGAIAFLKTRTPSIS